MSTDQGPAGTSWEGALQIIRFNWPFYAATCGFAALCLWALKFPGLVRSLAAAALVPTVYFSSASLLASHWIYDLSPLADWAWLPDWLPAPIGRWLLIQTGFDSTHGRLQKRLSAHPLAIVDIYGTPGVGGASVRRARNKNAGDSAIVTALPGESAVCDTILAVFSLHEIQTPLGREDFFRDLARALSPGGRLVVIEHLRDWKNFLVFGPGFLHFHPAREWRRCAAAAALRFEKEIAITPFVRVFLWRKP